MHKHSLWIVMLALIMVSCTAGPLSGPTPTPEVPRKQPEPSRPRVGGEISGLPDGTRVTIHICTPKGREAYTIGGPAPGSWEAVVTEASGLDYIVTAEAKGYVSQPISYTTHISGDTAYMVRDGQVTDKEAIHLDFHFDPSDSP